MQGSTGEFRDMGGFLGSCLPSGAMLGSAIGMKGAGGAAMHQLAAQGLGWAPTVGNLCTLLCFVLALALNAQLNEVRAASLPGAHGYIYPPEPSKCQCIAMQCPNSNVCWATDEIHWCFWSGS